MTNENEENSLPVNDLLEDAYIDLNETFHDPSNIHTFYQPYLHETNRRRIIWFIIGDAN